GALAAPIRRGRYSGEMESVQAANSLSSLLPCGRVVMQMRESQSSLPGLTPQVGFTRLAAHYTAQLGRARVAVQSILFANKFLRRGWTRGSSPRVTEACVARDCPSPGSRLPRSPPPSPPSGAGGPTAAPAPSPPPTAATAV